MASNQEDFVINVRLGSHASLPVRAKRSWNVARLKRALCERNSNINPDDVRIVFMGVVLKDSDTFETLDLGNFSYVHAVKGKMPQRTVRFDVQATSVGGGDAGLSPAAESLEAQRQSLPERYRNQYFVYCKRPCKKVCAGKLRVRCARCSSGAFIVDRGPSCWDDVLLKSRISGHCEANNCNGTTAEFYFKCAEHRTSEGESTVPLSLIMPNVNESDCLACADKTDQVLRYPCAEKHTTCLDCFTTYGEIMLNNREFELHPESGYYTLGCPNKCENSMIKEPHYFRIFGDELYDRYQKFGTEVLVLQAGGLLCPAPNCGNGMIPDPGMRDIRCDACSHRFCAQCQAPYHQGECEMSVDTCQEETAAFRVDPWRAERARWDRAAEDKIKDIAKRCPQCKSPTEKNEGCNHMTCAAVDPKTGKKCKFSWCWVCVKEWSRECQSAHWFPND